MLALVACGCQAENFPPQEVYVRPLDGTTGEAPELSARLTSEVFCCSERTAVATGMQLVTWPEHELVATTASSDDQSVVLNTTSALAPRWYALAIDLTHTPYVGSPRGPLDDEAGQHLVRRFHVGSLPLLTAAIGGATAPRHLQVWMLTSEPVVVAPGLALVDLVTVRFDGVEVACTETADGAGLAWGQVTFDCVESSSAFPTTFALDVAEGIASPTGVPLRDGQGRSPATVTWSSDNLWPPLVLDDAFVASTN